MNKYTKANKNQIASNLINEPKRGDGILWQVSKRGFKKAKDFKPVSHDHIVDEFRSVGKEDELHDYYNPKEKAPIIPISLDILLKQPKKGIFAQKYQGDRSLCWMSGFWCAQLQIKDKVGYELKFPAWTLGVLVGTSYKTDANMIRSAIIKMHGASGYQKWKRAIIEDLKGRTSVLDAIANYLGQKQKVAFSYIESSSSKKLLRSLGINVDNNHAIIYPHYKGNWTMKTSAYQKLEIS